MNITLKKKVSHWKNKAECGSNQSLSSHGEVARISRGLFGKLGIKKREVRFQE